jgi:hypothetical protein
VGASKQKGLNRIAKFGRSVNCDLFILTDSTIVVFFKLSQANLKLSKANLKLSKANLKLSKANLKLLYTEMTITEADGCTD